MPFEARKKEVFVTLERDATMSAPFKEAHRKALDSYFNQREGRLDNMIELLEWRDEPCHTRWLEKGKDAIGFLHTRTDLRSLWFAKFMNEEHAFFHDLTFTRVPALRDLMVKQTKALAIAEAEFEQKWKTILDADKTIEERMQTLAREYGEIQDDAVHCAAIVEKESRELLGRKVGDALRVVTGYVDFGAVENLIKVAMFAINKKMNEVQSRKLEIHALISREETVFAAFREARQMVQEFLKETSYPHIKDTFDTAEDVAEALPNRMLTPGQKEDAAAFGVAIKTELANVFRKAEEAYKAFAKKHEYLFFGPLGATYYQELLEDDTWKQFSRKWKEGREDIDELLRERTFLPDGDKLIDISLAELSDDDKRRAHVQIETACRELLHAWNQFKEMTKEPEWAIESRETLQSVLNVFR